METVLASLLIVDDDNAQRSQLRRYLERKRFVVTDASDGHQALERVQERSFDAVLLDIVMPGLSGLEVLQTLRRTQSLTALPVLMATAKGETADVVEALRLGANDYVTKPFNFPVVLARVQTQVLLKQSHEKLARANHRMKNELTAAAQVQKALLPETLPEIPGATIAWRFKPCAELAGDLINVVILDDKHVGLYVLDVSGHGVKAALLAVMVSRVLARLLSPSDLQHSSHVQEPSFLPTKVAAHLDQEFPWDSRTEQFFTLLYGILNRETGQFRFVTAGHPGLLYLTEGKQVQVIEKPSLPIGLGNGEYGEEVLTLQHGDRLYLYSDGLPDAMNREGKPFGVQQCTQALEQSRALPLQDSLTNLLRNIEEWCGFVPPHDDISVLAVEFA
jgi:sigma-B regulation protein RsbU (phosphoserine phosphatase)